MKRINLWSGPRNISTAMMYSFAQRPDTTVVDEPLYAYFLKLTGIDHPGREETLISMPSDKEDVLQQIMYGEYNSELVFFKNMAHHFLDLPFNMLDDFVNIFLIRDPEFVINSYIKERDKPVLSDLGYDKLLEMTMYLKAQEKSVFLIDSADILKNPEKALRRICEYAEIPFYNDMLSWKPGPKKEDGVWAKYWYKSLHKSEGFISGVQREVQIPERLMPLLRECQNIYEILQKEAEQI